MKMPLLMRERTWGLSLLLANLFYFSLVNPESSRSLVLFGGFFLLAVDLFLLFKLCLYLGGKLGGRQPAKINRLAGVATFVAILLIALQTIGQLSVRDAIGVICVGVIFLFYSSYYRFGHRG